VRTKHRRLIAELCVAGIIIVCITIFIIPKFFQAQNLLIESVFPDKNFRKYLQTIFNSERASLADLYSIDEISTIGYHVQDLTGIKHLKILYY
jgi:hypothetical protein